MNEFMEFFNTNSPENVSTSVKLVLLLTVLSLAPSILILMTCFTRIVVVLSFVQNGTCNPTDATKSSYYWFIVIFDIFYYGANLPRD